jgi:hypothetical protein
MEYVNGDEVTDNEHLAEAIDMTREGSAPADGTTGYDEPDSAGAGFTLRDSTFQVAIEELEAISTAPEESQEEIDRVMGMLQEARHKDNQRRAQVMAQAHEMLQDVWAPPE